MRRLTFHVSLVSLSLRTNFRISHRSLFHCRSEPLNGTSLSANIKHLRFETSNAAWILFERNFEGRHQLLSQLFCIDVSCKVVVQANFICQASQLQNSFEIFLHYFDLSTHRMFDMLLNFTASTTTTSGINFLSLWIEDFRNSCSKFLTSS